MMRVKQVQRWGKRLLLMRISTVAIVVTAILSVSIMAVTYYGQQVGNYIINIDDSSLLGLSLSETGEFAREDIASTLLATGIDDITNITYGDIPDDLHQLSGGSHNLVKNNIGRYFAYTFYLRSESSETVQYATMISSLEAYLDIHSAIRIMIEIDDEEPIIYAQAREDGSPEVHAVSNSTRVTRAYTTIPFTDVDNLVLVNQVRTIEPGQVVKYTITIWLEGADEQCTNGIKGGAIRLGMEFGVIKQD
ncbi:MAG: hypothetical protein PHW00_00935 [Clostridia bacterium]|nr:hypothetical protein [Clostridia bacterium]